MKYIFRIGFIVFHLIIFSFLASGQTNAKIESELTSAIKEVQKYSNYGDNRDDDKLYKAGAAFEKMLLKYTKNSATLRYGFPKLGDLIIIATSEDGRFRTYSWDEETGGTMHDYSVVYQYQGTDGKIYSRTDKRATAEDGGAGSFIYSIYEVNSGIANIYVACSTFIGSTNDHYGSAGLYKIEKNRLADNIKLFKTAKGLTDSIGFEYNFFSVVDRKERPIKLIQFDKKSQTLKIPIVIADEKDSLGRVTNRFINYQFNGTYFVKIK